MSELFLTEEQAKLWLEQKPVNPLTGRKLKEGSTTYRRLDSMANKMLDNKPANRSAAIGRCKKNWIKLTNEEASEYEQAASLHCPCGKWRMLHAVHTEFGEYYCVRCESSVSLVHFCYYCRNTVNVDD